MHIENFLKHKELNPWKKHEHIMDTQGASDTRRKKKKNQIDFFFFEIFQKKKNAHTNNKNK
jgi:hypothetical protein